jgi:excisionase family DNA binding protein
VISFDDAILRPLIERIVATVLDRLQGEQEALRDKLAYTEAEAAALLGVERYVLRDARLRGELSGSRVGKRVLYEREELLGYLRRQRGL